MHGGGAVWADLLHESVPPCGNLVGACQRARSNHGDGQPGMLRPTFPDWQTSSAAGLPGLPGATRCGAPGFKRSTDATINRCRHKQVPTGSKRFIGKLVSSRVHTFLRRSAVGARLLRQEAGQAPGQTTAPPEDVLRSRVAGQSHLRVHVFSSRSCSPAHLFCKSLTCFCESMQASIQAVGEVFGKILADKKAAPPHPAGAAAGMIGG